MLYSIVFSIVLAIVLFILLIVCIKRINMMSEHISNMESYISSMESSNTEELSHINGTFTGVYLSMKKLEKKVREHKHNYEFNDGVLYIKEPIFEKKSEND